MKSLIDKLAAGKIEYNRPEFEVSVQKIEEEMTPDSIGKGHINITSVNGVVLKGVAYSSNQRLRLADNQFGGKNCILEYEVDTRHMDPADHDEICGEIDLITNGGEHTVTFDIKVVRPVMKSSIGNIETMEQFVNLVQMSYEEALKYFLSSEFTAFLENTDPGNLPLYEGLIQGLDKKLALEEFLIATGRKQPVHLEISEKYRQYDACEGSFQDFITITRDSWGYVDILVQVQGDFITKCKTRITADEFAGNKYEYTYLIDKSRLHKGINYGRLTFIYSNHTMVYDIKIYHELVDHTRDKEADENMIALLQQYLQFRMHKCNMEEWATRSFSLAEKLLTYGKYRRMAMLMKAQILLSQGNHNEAGWILDDFIKNNMSDVTNHYEIYCFYLYVKSLQKREAAYTAQALDEVREIYEKHCHSYLILWILFYMDEKYDVNKSLKYTMIKGEYSSGCRSPLLYFEALSVLNEQPGLLRVLNRFEIALLQFGTKYDWIDDRLALNLVELANHEKNYSKSLYDTLTGLYEKKPSDDILTAICTILIRGNKTGKKYFAWYEQGVKKELRIANLFESYLFSIDDDYEGLLPQMVYMYFLYNAKTLGRRQSFLYANIIRNKKRMPDIYENYLKMIEQYLVSELFCGHMDRELSIIYSDVLKSSLINGDIAKKLPDIVQTYEIDCKDPAMQEVIVIHREVQKEEHSKIRNGRAYVQIYTEDPIILFADSYGKRYADVAYEQVRLSNMQKYLELSFDANQDNEYLLIHFAREYENQKDHALDKIEIYKNIMKFPSIRRSYKEKLTKEMIDFYFDNYHGSGLEEYLRTVDKDGLDQTTRTKVMEMMIARGMYPDAFDMIEDYGFDSVETGLLVRLCARQVEVHEEAENPTLTELCQYLFKIGKYTEGILKYLSKFGNGCLADLIRLWKKEKEFVYENHILEEKILVQAMFTDQYMVNLRDIFKSYYQYGIVRNIKSAFYVYMCGYYIQKKNDIRFLGHVQYLFSYLEQDVASGYLVPNICKIALLCYASGRQNLMKDKIKLYQEMLSYMCNHGVMLEEFKKFAKWFEVPFFLLDKQIVDYRTEPSSRVFISYTMKDQHETTEEVTEEMHQIFPGIYTDRFVLFYGDELQYKIREEKKDGQIVESKPVQICLNDEKAYTTENRFDQLNHILIKRDHSETEQEEKLSQRYLEEQKITEQIFTAI